MLQQPQRNEIAVAADTSIRKILSQGTDRERHELIEARLFDSFIDLLEDQRFINTSIHMMVFAIPHIAYMVIESGQVTPLTYLFLFVMSYLNAMSMTNLVRFPLVLTNSLFETHWMMHCDISAQAMLL
jgi:hypothetical protein